MSGTAATQAGQKKVAYDPSLLLSNFERASLRVVKIPDQLSVPCLKVVGNSFDKASRIAQDLIETAKHLDSGPKLTCEGLAANQLGYHLRVIVVRVNRKFKAFINPEIVFQTGSKQSVEGCFSFPGRHTKIERATTIMIKASNMLGSRKFKGMEAIVFQHEIGHLNGELV
jgi:peptide deformylase